MDNKIDEKLEVKNMFIDIENIENESNIHWNRKPISFVIRNPTQHESVYEYTKCLCDTNVPKMTSPWRHIIMAGCFGETVEYKIRKFLGM